MSNKSNKTSLALPLTTAIVSLAVASLNDDNSTKNIASVIGTISSLFVVYKLISASKSTAYIPTKEELNLDLDLTPATTTTIPATITTKETTIPATITSEEKKSAVNTISAPENDINITPFNYWKNSDYKKYFNKYFKNKYFNEDNLKEDTIFINNLKKYNTTLCSDYKKNLELYYKCTESINTAFDNNFRTDICLLLINIYPLIDLNKQYNFIYIITRTVTAGFSLASILINIYHIKCNQIFILHKSPIKSDKEKSLDNYKQIDKKILDLKNLVLVTPIENFLNVFYYDNNYTNSFIILDKIKPKSEILEYINYIPGFYMDYKKIINKHYEFKITKTPYIKLKDKTKNYMQLFLMF